MKAKLFENLLKVLAGAALSVFLFASPVTGNVLNVYAGESDDKDGKDDIEKLKQLGDLVGSTDISDTVKNSGFTTQTTGTASKPDTASSTGVPTTGKVTTGVDPTTGLKTVTTEASISESYHQDYDTYELSINGRFFFYSNVGNGAMTSKAVTLEVPANIFFTCEKDGVAYAAQSGKPITAKGTYVFNVTATETVGDTIYIYNAVYRFRIADKVSGAADDSQTTDIPYDIDEEPGLLDPEAKDQPSQEQPYEDLSTKPEDSFDDSELSSDERAALNEILNNDSDSDPEGISGDDSVSKTLEELAKELENDNMYTTEGINRRTGMASAYDATSGYYKNTLRNSMSFFTDIPNGMITRHDVTLRTTDELTFTIYKDGEAYEFDPEQKISEPGSYTVIPVAEDVVYYDAYQSETPIFSFRIIGDAVNDLSLYRAPEGFYISEIMVDGLKADSIKMLGNDAALLREDGKYTITVTDGNKVLDLDFLLDRTRPRFKVNLEKNKATFDFLSKDVTETVIYKDGKLLSSGTVQKQVKEAGSYEVYAYDKAGNRGMSRFKVKYGFNSGAIVAILLVLAAVAGLFVYVRTINSKVKVR